MTDGYRHRKDGTHTPNGGDAVKEGSPIGRAVLLAWAARGRVKEPGGDVQVDAAIRDLADAVLALAEALKAGDTPT